LIVGGTLGPYELETSGVVSAESPLGEVRCISYGRLVFAFLEDEFVGVWVCGEDGKVSMGL